MFTHHQDHDEHQSLWCKNDVVPPDTMTVSVGYPIKYWQAKLASLLENGPFADVGFLAKQNNPFWSGSR